MTILGAVDGDLGISIIRIRLGVTTDAHVLLLQVFCSAIETFLMSATPHYWDATIVKSSFGTFFNGTRWTLASAIPERQSTEAINAAVSFIVMGCKKTEMEYSRENLKR